ncbi:MAG: Stp1/IreP family PP2C-type Ser/Thr phosphatase [Desulfobacter sp.]|nr:MAG: Stp1/IreP family PP2C-type Ser/Thr phosphatase [Desulfobacter sp.]
MTKFSFSGKTDQGLCRKKNEDALVIDESRGFCLVADGIGGSAAGDIASRMFADTAKKIFSRPQVTEALQYTNIQSVFLMANEQILKYANHNPGCKGMGCTAELLAVSPGRFVLGHIGDSRTYRLRNGELKQLTSDHTLVQEQLEQGLITREEADRHSFRNVISRAVGIKKEIALDVLRGNLYAGDIFLLCSDGLTDMVPDDQIKALLASGAGLADKTAQLIRAANDRGGKDNITVALARIS